MNAGLIYFWKKALNGIIPGIFFIITIASIGYAANYGWQNPSAIRNVDAWTLLSASWWNLLVGNVDNLNERVGTIEWSGGIVPGGAVMAFNLSSCPTGWSECVSCRGRFLRALDNGAGIDTGRVLASTQEDVFKDHAHAASSDTQGNHTHAASSDTQGNHTHAGLNSYWGTSGWSYGLVDSSSASSSSYHSLGSAGAHAHNITVNAAGAHAHNITVASTTGGAETRPKNIAFLYCIKN